MKTNCHAATSAALSAFGLLALAPLARAAGEDPLIRPSPITSPQAHPPVVKRTILQQHDLGGSGREVVQARVELAPGAEFGQHWHPGEEIINVLEGTLEYRVEGQTPVTLRAGDVFFIPAGTIHSARNVGRGNAAELATYIVEKGKPLVVMVK